MKKQDTSKMNITERIVFCKEGLMDCEKKQRRILWLLLPAIFGLILIGQYVFTDAEWTYLIPGVFGFMNFWIYINLRRVYSSLTEVYEAELDAAKDNQSD